MRVKTGKNQTAKAPYKAYTQFIHVQGKKGSNEKIGKDGEKRRPSRKSASNQVRQFAVYKTRIYICFAHIYACNAMYSICHRFFWWMLRFIYNKKTNTFSRSATTVWKYVRSSLVDLSIILLLLLLVFHLLVAFALFLCVLMFLCLTLYFLPASVGISLYSFGNLRSKMTTFIDVCCFSFAKWTNLFYIFILYSYKFYFCFIFTICRAV